MSNLIYETILDKLEESHNRASEQAVGLALLHSESQEHIAKLAAILAKKRNEIAFIYLIQAFHKLPNSIRKIVISSADEISGTLRALSKSDEPQTRKNVIDIISADIRPELSYILALLLRDELAYIREQAAQAILSIAIKIYKDMESSDINSDELNRFCYALNLALDSFAGHFRTEIIESVMYIGYLLPEEIWKRFTSHRSKFSHAAIEILRKHSLPQFASFAFMAFTTENMGKDIAQIVSACRRTDFMRKWISFGWYRFDCMARKNLARIKELRWLSGNYKLILELTPELQLRFIDVLMMTSIPTKEKINMLKHMLIAQSSFVREYVVLSLLRFSDVAEAKDILHRASALSNAIDFSPRVIALLRNYFDNRIPPHITQQGARKKMLRQLENAKRNKPTGHKYFEQAWKAIRHLKKQDWPKVIERVKELDSDFYEHLKEKLFSFDPSERVFALMIIRRSNLVNDYITQIYKLCEDKDPIVRSAAIRTLAHNASAIVEHKIIEALDDEDARVQANAIEALDIVDIPNLTEILQPKLNSQNNRIRANAIKAILKPQYILAINALLSMLEHPNANFRKSALWVMTQTIPIAIIDKVRKLAENDPDADVQKLARKAINKIAASLKSADIGDNSSVSSEKEKIDVKH